MKGARLNNSQQPWRLHFVFRCRFHWGFYYRLFGRLCNASLLGLRVVRFRSFLGCELFFKCFHKYVFLPSFVTMRSRLPCVPVPVPHNAFQTIFVTKHFSACIASRRSTSAGTEYHLWFELKEQPLGILRNIPMLSSELT